MTDNIATPRWERHPRPRPPAWAWATPSTSPDSDNGSASRAEPDLLKLGRELLPLRLLVLQDGFCPLQLRFQLHGNTANMLWETDEGPTLLEAKGSWVG